jgi:glycosyltransferase involved in cell wall biosynthesis
MKVLIIQNTIMHYRLPLYNEISSFCDLTVAHSGKASGIQTEFKEVILKYKKIGAFTWQYGLKYLIIDFDVIIVMFDIKWLSFLNLILFNKKKTQRIYFWGIGVSSQNGLNKTHTFDNFRFWIAKKATGLIFYSDYPKAIYEKNKIHKSKLFTAHNTVHVHYDKNKYSKKFIFYLFIGSLNPRKKLDHLIDAYSVYKSETKDYKKLQIIGSGSEEKKLKIQVKKLGLLNDVIFLGRIIDEQIKLTVFEQAIALISPGQAGLSVLESMAYGVPYITYKDAITGGEIFNIENKKNGFLIDGKNDLVNLMKKLTFDKGLLQQMSDNAIYHYNINRSIENTANTFKEIINQ